MEVGRVIAGILGAAVLAPLASFVIILLMGPRLGNKGKGAGTCATIAILVSCILSMSALGIWITNHPIQSSDSHAAGHDGHDSGGHDDHDKHDDGHDAGGDESDGHKEDDHGEDHASQFTNDQILGGAAEDSHGHGSHAPVKGPYYSYDVYKLGSFGEDPRTGEERSMSISVFVDTLTVCMFAMVTLIATCIHFYATGYMHDELEGDEYVDHEVTMPDGSHLHRPGRYHRFFQALSLFCFSMLGLVLSGNIAMTFVFWELVGICSYFLIGFYVERKSASTAANKAFIVNRVGDFGMIIGLMALWASFGTFSFETIFEKVRPESQDYALQVPDEMVLQGAKEEVNKLVIEEMAAGATRAEIANKVDEKVAEWRDPESSGVAGGYGRWLLIVAGVGIFCGCIGKSAQFPLHTWLPDAMEGPTPVSALVHSATMVAAGVFLVARFYPVFCPEVLFVIALVGCITLLLAATIAITATDIKRVLAYSTVSQLGYMMLALGIGGWLAGVMHLFTHAFFKSLLFMCSGSVIHAVHTNEMPEMGGLRKKMPFTAYTMLIGCMAIAGAGIPFTFNLFGGHYHLGFSGFYSKDAIVEQALSFIINGEGNGAWAVFFCTAAAGGAAITAFYMFRLWYMTFAGEPRNKERYDHAHESPPVMYRPLILLSVFAIAVAWKPAEGIIGSLIALAIFGVIYFRSKTKSEPDHAHDDHGHGHSSSTNPLLVAIGLSVLVLVVASVCASAAFTKNITLANLLEQARPAGTLATESAVLMNMTWPDEHLGHLPNVKPFAGWIAFLTALAGFSLATVFYGLQKLDPGEAKQAFAPVHRFLINKWWFDELYDIIFVKPAHFLAGVMSAIDQKIIDRFLNGVAWCTRVVAQFWERTADRQIVDGFVNGLANRTYRTGVSLKRAQTGRLRQYVMFIALGTVVAFVFATFVWNYAFAG